VRMASWAAYMQQAPRMGLIDFTNLDIGSATDAANPI